MDRPHAIVVGERRGTYLMNAMYLMERPNSKSYVRSTHQAQVPMKRSDLAHRSVALMWWSRGPRMLVSMDQQQLETSAASLRAVIEEIDAGGLEASESERAYLAGSVETLERILRS